MRRLRSDSCIAIASRKSDDLHPYADTIHSYQKILGAVSGLLICAETFCAEKGLNHEEIIQARLAPGGLANDSRNLYRPTRSHPGRRAVSRNPRNSHRGQASRALAMELVQVRPVLGRTRRAELRIPAADRLCRGHFEVVRVL